MTPIKVSKRISPSLNATLTVRFLEHDPEPYPEEEETLGRDEEDFFFYGQGLDVPEMSGYEVILDDILP